MQTALDFFYYTLIYLTINKHVLSSVHPACKIQKKMDSEMHEEAYCWLMPREQDMCKQEAGPQNQEQFPGIRIAPCLLTISPTLWTAKTKPNQTNNKETVAFVKKGKTVGNDV